MAKTPPSGTLDSVSKGKGAARATMPTRKAAPQKRETLRSIRNHVDEIGARLQQANTLTQQSIQSLQTAFSQLEKRVNHDGTINKAALTRRVDQLSDHFTGLIAQTRAAVAKDLQSVQNNPTQSGLKAALESAEAHVYKAEKAQAAALTKVNRHIADLARAIDARLSQESAARSAGFDALDQDLKSLQLRTQEKLKDVEQSSATAIIRLGEQVVTLSQDFKHRTDSNTQAISGKISEIAIKTQREFDDYKSQMERRMESIEENQRNLDSYTDRSLAGLTTRIDNLEYGLTTSAPPAAVQASDQIAGSDIDDAFSPSLDLQPATPTPLLLEPEAPAPQLTLVPTKPVMTAPQLLTPPSAQTPPQSPVEFVPATYTPPQPQTFAPYAQDDISPSPQPFSPPTTPSDGPQLFVASDSPVFPNSATSASDRAVADLIGAEDLPYADPAYAESGANDRMKRPGTFETLKKSQSGGSKISARNLRVAGMALLIATVGYFALRGTLNRPSETLAEQEGAPSLFVQEIDNGTAPIARSAAEAGAQTAPAIGQYADNQGMTSEGDKVVPETLEAAAKAGDAVAEFQLGLSRLESGQTEEAISLIRAAANKGQPAAQYRLAKLYEAGEGLAADAKMARQLTERAATNGNRIAMHDLALYYAEGRGGVDVDIKQAAGWFEKAAQRGVVDSQYNLGVLYESGQGLPKNLTEAYVWYSIAAGQGDQFARKHIDVLKQQVSAADIKRAEARVTDFKPIALDEAANGIFRNVSWAQPKTEKDAKADIEEVQYLLGQMGYDAGRPDGSIGPKTRKAIITFQKDNSLSQTGSVDSDLITQLQRAAGA